MTGHFLEAVGTRRRGLQVAWANRARQLGLDTGVEPSYATGNLQELADILAEPSRRFVRRRHK